MSISEKYAGSAAAVVTAAAVLALLQRQLGSRRPPYPPGPKGFPIVGNVFDFPKGLLWEGFAKMAAEYGERQVFRSSHSHVACLT